MWLDSFMGTEYTRPILQNLPIVSYNIFGDNVVCGFYYD